MDTAKEKIAAKIRALLAKTVSNGCSEEEAMAAMAKASAMMAAHQITLTEAEVKSEGFETIRRDFEDKRKSFVCYHMCVAIGEYTDCKPFISGDANSGVPRFFGLKSDAEFAGWLCDSLADFILYAADRHIRSTMAKMVREQGMTARQAQSAMKNKTQMWESFVLGCTGRIRERMRATKPVQKVRASSTSTALVVIDKRKMVDCEFAERFGKLKPGKAYKKTISAGSYSAGQDAGNRASLNRPIGKVSTSGLLR